MPRLLKVAEPLVEWAFRKETFRILAELERYVEAQPKQCDREKAPGERKAHARSSKGVHTGGPCLVLPDVFQIGTDLARALQSFSRQSKPSSSS